MAEFSKILNWRLKVKKTERSALALILILVIVITTFSSGCITCKRSATTGSGLFSEVTVCENVDPQTSQPLDKTAVFPVDFETIFCAVKLNKAPSNTEIKVQWFDNSNKLLLEKVVKTQGTRYVAFSLQRATDNPFTAGNYAVKLFANGKLQTTVSFVVGSADVYSAKDRGADNPIIDGSEDGGQSQVTPWAEAPVVTLQQVAPNNFDLPAEEMEKTATPGEETIIAEDGMELVIPAGAVSVDTRVVVKEFTESPPLTTPEEAADLPEAVGISRVYDFGPDGTKFSLPVQITIPYDAAVLPPDIDEKNISLAYFNGQNWVAIGGQVDTARHTVSIRTMDFPGIAFMAVATYVGLAVATTVIAGAIYVIEQKAYGWLKGEPTDKGEAYKYVTPEDSVVKSYAEKAQFWAKVDGAYKYYPLSDPLDSTKPNPQLAAIFETFKTQPQALPQLVFGKNQEDKVTYVKGGNTYHPWSMPWRFFWRGMKDECATCANSYTSVFAGFGIPAKSVSGTVINEDGVRAPHVWTEVMFGDEMYYIDNEGLIEPLEKVVQRDKLVRDQMWDKDSQRPYDPAWWLDLPPTYVLAAHVDNPVIKPGSWTTLTVTILPAKLTTVTALPATKITVDGNDKGSTDSGGFFSTEYTMPEDAKGPRTIVVRAPDLGLSKVIEVTAPWIQVTVTPKQVQLPGKVTAAVTVLPKGETPLEVTVFGQAYTGKTNANGSANIGIPVPEQADPGPNTLIVRATDLDVDAEDSFTLAAAIKLDADTLYDTYKQGDALIINVRVSPPRVTAIELEGIADSRCQTDEDGFAFIDRVINKDATPKLYTLRVLAPQFVGVFTDVSFKVIAASTVADSLPLPTIDYFSASPTTITAGETCTLRWSVSNATRVRLDGVDVAATSSRTGTLNSTHTFELMATNAAGLSVNQLVKVTVVAKTTPTTPITPTTPSTPTTPTTPTAPTTPAIGATRQRVEYCSGSSGPIAYKCNEIKLANGDWVLNGIKTYYSCSPSNPIASTETYVNGKANGPKRDYDTNGKLTYASEYVNNVQVKYSIYDTNHNCVMEIGTLTGGTWKKVFPKCP